jgi:hypothetical protein
MSTKIDKVRWLHLEGIDPRLENIGGTLTGVGIYRTDIDCDGRAIPAKTYPSGTEQGVDIELHYRGREQVYAAGTPRDDINSVRENGRNPLATKDNARDALADKVNGAVYRFVAEEFAKQGFTLREVDRNNLILSPPAHLKGKTPEETFAAVVGVMDQIGATQGFKDTVKGAADQHERLGKIMGDKSIRLDKVVAAEATEYLEARRAEVRVDVAGTTGKIISNSGEKLTPETYNKIIDAMTDRVYLPGNKENVDRNVAREVTEARGRRDQGIFR